LTRGRSYIFDKRVVSLEVLVACCIALAMLIAFVRGAWALIPLPGRRRQAPAEFAPAAHRPAPAHERSQAAHDTPLVHENPAPPAPQETSALPGTRAVHA
jgi:hypothetical protein